VHAEANPKDAVSWEFIPNQLNRRYSSKSQAAKFRESHVSSVPPFGIASIGFHDKTEKHAMRALFPYFKHWPQPRRIASKQATGIVSLPAGGAAKLARWRRWNHKLPRTRLIADVERAPKDTCRRLTRSPDKLRPSSIEFAAFAEADCRMAQNHPLAKQNHSAAKGRAGIIASDMRTASDNTLPNRQEYDQA
jgi:hypothetical protein